MTRTSAELVICGAGIAGIAAAYHLAVKKGLKNLVIVEQGDPLSLTSDKSTEGYRNWWPDPSMIALMSRSIELLEEIAQESANRINLNRRGYLYATANEAKIPLLIETAEDTARKGAGELRVHASSTSNYQPSPSWSFDFNLGGADLLTSQSLIRQHFPYLSPSTQAVLHVRRAGWLSAQQLGMYLLEQARMLPSENAFWVAEELQRRFGLKYWQFALSATDANRFALRLARAITKRPRVLVFHGCYHGTVDEAYAWLVEGKPASRPGNIGPQVDPTLTTKVVEWNDPEALEEALRPGDVAAVLAEPVMTNVGIVQPAPGFHQALRELTRRYGTLLILDETHTLSAGPGGYTRAHGLEPDMLTVGKPLGSGIPSAAYGFSEEVGRRAQAVIQPPYADTGGIGGTLAANALSLAAMRATLEHVLTEAAYQHMIALGRQLEAEVQAVMTRYRLPWHVTRVGCRVEYLFRPNPAQNGSEALAGQDPDLDPFIHLFMLNRGILLTPFHNMTLISPETTAAQVRRHTEVFEEAVRALIG